MSDEFVRRLKKGDEQAWSELSERLLKMAHVLVARASPSIDADDIVNETLVRVRRDLKRFEERSKVTTWAIGICRHVWLEMIRSGRKEVAADVEAMLEVKSGDGGADDPLHALLGDELIEVVRACLKEVSAADRALLTMAYWQDLPYAAIAEQCGMSAGAVKTAMFRARKRIAECVARKQGYADLLPPAGE